MNFTLKEYLNYMVENNFILVLAFCSLIFELQFHISVQKPAAEHIAVLEFKVEFSCCKCSAHFVFPKFIKRDTTTFPEEKGKD